MFVTALLRIGAVDVVVTLLLALVIIGSVGDEVLPAFAGLAIVRAGVAVASLARVLAPVRAWQRIPDDDPRVLTEVEDALDGLWRRFSLMYGSGWAVATLVLFVLGYVGSLPTSSFGQLELMIGFTLALALTAGLPALLSPLIDDIVGALRRELARRRIELGLPARPRSASIGRQLSVFLFGLLVALIVGGNGMSMREHGQRLRGEVLSELRERVAQVALRSRDGALALEPGVSVVTRAELPAELQLQLQTDDDEGDGEAPELGTLASAYDHHDEQGFAAVAIDGQRWLLAHAEAELHVALMLLMQLGIAIGALGVVAFAGSSFRRTIVEPLAELDAATRRVAEHGELRSLARIVPARNDELGSLIGNFNHMLDVFEELADAAASVAKGDLRVKITGTGELPDALRGMLARLNEVVEQIRATSLELASAATEIHAITREQEAAAEQQSQRVLDVSDTVATLAQSADDISSNANEVLANAEQVLAKTDSMIDRITKLSAQTGSVRELLELIREVADRSDLLALNGSLEATRAGEAGRGFALVASEMRRLAERVTGTIGDVRERLSEIEAAGASTVQATDESRRLAGETAAAARSISTVTAHQSSETEMVSVKVFEVAEVMIATVEATRQTIAAVEGLRQQALELQHLTGQFQLRDDRSGPANAQEPRK